MPFFPNVMLELWEYRESDTDFNPYGEAELEYYQVDIVSCDFQPLSPTDSLKEYGEILQDTYKTYIDLDSPVTDTMIFRIQGEQETYKVVGTPIRNNHVLNHTKLILKKERIPTPLP